MGQLPLQKRGRIVLGEDLGLEVQTRRQAEPGMGRAREAIDATMLAAAIGIDRTVETDKIGRASCRERV
jgi:hypothetical protein